MNDDESTANVTLVCVGPDFFTQDNCLLYMDAPHQQAILYVHAIV